MVGENAVAVRTLLKMYLTVTNRVEAFDYNGYPKSCRKSVFCNTWYLFVFYYKTNYK